MNSPSTNPLQQLVNELWENSPTILEQRRKGKELATEFLKKSHITEQEFVEIIGQIFMIEMGILSSQAMLLACAFWHLMQKQNQE